MKSSNSAAPVKGKLPRVPTAADWAAITANAVPDPADLDRVTEDARWAGAQVFDGTTTPAQARAIQASRRVGQRGPQVAPVKKQISFRIRPAVLEAWRATGPGWMSRMDEWLAQAPFVNPSPPAQERRRAAMDRQVEDEA